MPVAKRQPLSIEVASALADDLAALTHDPAGFVRYAYQWGVPGTSLADKTGPDEWQTEHLNAIGVSLRANPYKPVLEAIASGHGIGKSCDGSWVTQWALMTCEDTRGVVTANTDTQLRTKTWAEMSKWYHLLIPPLRELFTLQATSIHSALKEHERTWRIDTIPWSAHNVEAFAGLHNQGKRIFVLFDEASAIDDVIWETTEGALTDADTEILWLVRGNPTRNTGRFKECFGRYRHRWMTKQIDSRSVAITNKGQIQQWIDDYGEDSDFVRIRVKGQFPRAGSTQFIPGDIVDAAVARKVEPERWEPIIIGVDVARFGDDETVIAVRKGRDAKSFKWTHHRNKDTMFVASEAARLRKTYNADIIFVDETGLGAGVVDRLRMLREPVLGVNFGSKPLGLTLADETMKVRNRRAEMWAAMRDWLKGGSIKDDPQLIADLTAVEYGYDADNSIILEKKDDMKKRGLASPDMGDALALTFAAPVNAVAMDEDDYADEKRRTANRVTGY